MRPACAVLVALAAATTLAVAGTTTSTILPETTGSIERFPFLGITQPGGAGYDIQSTCFMTTETNLRFRRGFMEFSVPLFRKGIISATLIITESKMGEVPFPPFPPDVHELSYYPADLSVDVSDYDASTELFATLETDNNEVNRVFTFDVTDIARESNGSALGFRIKLEIDPSTVCSGSEGSAFGDVFIVPPKLVIVANGHGKPKVPRIRPGR